MIGIVMELVVCAVSVGVIANARATWLGFVPFGGAGGLILGGGCFLAGVWPFSRIMIVHVLFVDNNTFALAFTIGCNIENVTHFTRTGAAAVAAAAVFIDIWK